MPHSHKCNKALKPKIPAVLTQACVSAGLNHPNSNGSGLCSGGHCSLCGKFVPIAHCVEVSEASLRHSFQRLVMSVAS